jgi:hypothetical protein
MLVEAAWKAIRKDTALRVFFEKIAAKSGKKRAIVAVARKLSPDYSRNAPPEWLRR